MNREEVIESLISSDTTKWNDDDHEFLTGLEDAQLEKMVPVKNEEPEPAPEPKPEPVPEPKPEPAPEPEPKPVTQEEYIKNAPPEVRDLLTNALARQKEEREQMIKAILSNEQNKFNENWLKGQSTEILAGLAALAAEPTAAPTSHGAPIYAGAAGPAPTNNAPKEEPLGLPVYNFAN